MVDEAPPRIAVVGSINRDTISTPDGVKTESYGGMLYSILALAAIARVEIHPVCNLGEDVENPVRDLLVAHPSVVWDGIRVVPAQNPHCHLEYDAAGRKQETLYGGVPPIEADRIAPLASCEALCVNFITGQELGLQALRDMRALVSCPVFMDLHSLTLASDAARRRYLRRPPDWQDWVACADFLQMNETEAGLLSETHSLDESSARSFGESVLGLGPTAVVITRGSKGSWTAYRQPDGSSGFLSCRLPAQGPAVDETGCGDVFLMGFTWAYLCNGDPEFATRFANRVAGINCCLRGIEEVSQIGRLLPEEEHIQIASGTHGEGATG